MREAFRGVFEPAKTLDHVSKKHQTNVHLGHLSNLLTPLSVLMYI
jgi:hypothetical protein